MPPRSASECFSPAFEHAKSQLFRPFRFAQWWRLALVGMFAGEMSSGGCNVNFPGSSSTHSHGTSQETFLPAFPPELAAHPLRFAAIIAGVFVIFLVLAVVFTYLASVMRFILFDSVVTRECHVRQGWRRRKAIGLRLFWWQISVAAISFVAFATVVGIPALLAWRLGWFETPRDHILALVLGGFTFLFLLLLLVVALVLLQVLTKDFVVPQMALEGIGPVEGWRRMLARMKAEKAGYAGYVGMKFVLAIAAVFLFSIIAVVVMLVFMIPVAGAAIAAFFGAKAAGLTWNVVTIAAAVVYGCIALTVLISAIALVHVPVIVFFPAYSIYFFAPRYPPLADLLWPSSSAPIAPAITPPLPQ